MVSWSREKERNAYENILGRKMKILFAKFRAFIFFIDSYPTGAVSCVSDSYDIFSACEHIWGEDLHDKVMARDGTLVIRADSGKKKIYILTEIHVIFLLRRRSD